MNIAFSVVRSLQVAGGIEKYTAELGTRLVQRGHQVTVYTIGNPRNPAEQYRGMTVVQCAALDGKFTEKISAGATAAIRIARTRHDIVHQHSIAAGAFNWLAGRHKASVLQMHGIEWRRTRWGPAARFAIRGLERLAIAQYRHWTAVSRTQCRILRERYGIAPVYIPTATEILPPVAPERIASEYGLSTDGFILFAGRLVPEKGVHLLIDAFRATKTDLRLVLAGDAPTEPSYAQSLRMRAQGDPRISFLGAVSGRKLRELFSNCYLYVQPSVIEGLSIALLEAMSHRRCCLVSDIEENWEAVQDTGVVFRSGDAEDLARQLKTLLPSTHLVRELGARALARVSEHYSWESVTTRIEELYQSACQDSI